MLSQKARTITKDVLLVSMVFLALSGAYYTFAVAERFRALSAAYIVQSEQLITILNQQAQKAPQPNAGE